MDKTKTPPSPQLPLGCKGGISKVIVCKRILGISAVLVFTFTYKISDHLW